MNLSQFVVKKTIEHLELTVFSVIIAILVAMPIGIVFAKWKRAGISRFFIYLVLTVQTIPALALMGLIIAFLMLVAGLPTTGIFPGIFVLSICACFPILSNMYIGIESISAKKIEIAKDINITRFQIFLIEMQLALFSLLKGIRASTVSTVSMATLVSLIGSGGLGDLIMQGLRELSFELILSGAVPAALLGITLDWFISQITKWLKRRSHFKS